MMGARVIKVESTGPAGDARRRDAATRDLLSTGKAAWRWVSGQPSELGSLRKLLLQADITSRLTPACAAP
jgi:hypothetical protein